MRDTRRQPFRPTTTWSAASSRSTGGFAERRSAYLRLARGYKAGGFNVSLAGVDFGTVDNVNLSPAKSSSTPNR